MRNHYQCTNYLLVEGNYLPWAMSHLWGLVGWTRAVVPSQLQPIQKLDIGLSVVVQALPLELGFELIWIQLSLQGSCCSREGEAHEPQQADTEVEEKALRYQCLKFHSSRAASLNFKKIASVADFVKRATYIVDVLHSFQGQQTSHTIACNLSMWFNILWVLCD